MNEDNMERNILLAIAVCILLIVAIVVFTFWYSENHYPNPTKIRNFTETLEIINKNCGSVFFTKQYGNDNFTIYKQECKSGEHCKPGYVTIESCLNEVKDE